MSTPEPGVHSDIPEHVYHADRGSLSVSGTKLLLPPSVPALFKWNRDHGRPEKSVFDMGHAAHARVLGVGQTIRYIQGKTAKGDPSDGWASKYAQDQRAEAYAAGEIPLLESQRGVIEGMEAAIRAHPLASVLLDPEHGKPEQSLYAIDPATGVMRRGRLDWLPTAKRSRMIIPDYKTSESAEPIAFGKSAANYGYHRQDPWYCDLAKAVGLADDPAFVFIVQEKTPPFLVNVIQLVPEAVELGRRQNRIALDTYARCMEKDEWPGYGDSVSPAALPVWFHMQAEEQEENAA